MGVEAPRAPHRHHAAAHDDEGEQEPHAAVAIRVQLRVDPRGPVGKEQDEGQRRCRERGRQNQDPADDGNRRALVVVLTEVSPECQIGNGEHRHPHPGHQAAAEQPAEQGQVGERRRRAEQGPEAGPHCDAANRHQLSPAEAAMRRVRQVADDRTEREIRNESYDGRRAHENAWQPAHGRVEVDREEGEQTVSDSCPDPAEPVQDHETTAQPHRGVADTTGVPGRPGAEPRPDGCVHQCHALIERPRPPTLQRPPIAHRRRVRRDHQPLATSPRAPSRTSHRPAGGI